MKQKVYSIPEAASALGVGYHRVWYAVAMRKVAATRAGRATVLTQAALNTLREIFTKGAK